MKQFLSGTFYNLINGLKKSNYKRKFGTGKGHIGSLSCWILLMLLGITGCGKREAVIQNVNTAMGTIFQQTLYVEDTNQNVGEDILKLVEELENSLLSWRVEGAELSKINGQAGNAQGAVLSERLEGILTECFQVSRASEGAFDVTILPVSRLWNMDEQAGKETGFVVPTKEQVAEALQNTGYESVSLEGNRIFLPGELMLDLGAVGKGVALDEIAAFLAQQQTVKGAVISAGGSILTYGSKPEGESWQVGIINPQDTSKSLGVFSLKGQWFISTSGDYERYFEVDDKRYHHIMNPHTGYPAESGVSSVTILCKSGLLSDALSTACFVLGVEEGMELVRQYDAEALFVSTEGEIAMTDGMKKYFSLSN